MKRRRKLGVKSRVTPVDESHGNGPVKWPGDTRNQSRASRAVSASSPPADRVITADDDVDDDIESTLPALQTLAAECVTATGQLMSNDVVHGKRKRSRSGSAPKCRRSRHTHT